jgi:RHS repeat-associated protein
MTWGPDLSGTEQGAGGVGGLLWTVDDNDDGMIPGYDGNGNIIAWVDASDGSLAGTREYGAFGEDVTFSGVAHEIPFGFSTKYQDSLSGLYYYGYRYYNASTGRWLNQDPLGEQGGLNLYGFIGNSGVNYWDMWGLIDFKIVAKSYIAQVGNNIGSFSYPEFSLWQRIFMGDYVAAEEARVMRANQRLILLAAATDLSFSEDPTNDDRDGVYRLFSSLKLSATVNDGILSVNPQKIQESIFSTDTGKEGFLQAPSLTISDIKGALSEDCKTYTFKWKGSGRPHALAEPAMQLVSFRINRYIWHQIEGEIIIENNEPKLKIKKFDGSSFPSHRLFINGNIEQTIQQGKFVELWDL